MELCSGIPSWLGGNQSTCKCRSLWSHRLDPWVRRIPWRRKCNPLQYSCQKNPTDRGALWAAVCGVAKSWTQVSKHAQRSTVGFTLEIGQSKQSAAAAAKSLQSCLTLWDPIDGSPPGSPVPGILQAKNTGVGCHFLLQCTKVKSESEVAQSCPTHSDPMDYSLPGSSVRGVFQQEYWSRLPLLPQSNLRVHLLSSRSFCDSHSSCVFDKIEVQFIYFCQRT